VDGRGDAGRSGARERVAESPIPWQTTPKQIAKAFYDGTLTDEDRRTMGPGMRHLIALAETENDRATTAKRAALKDLSELAELARDQDGAGTTHQVNIVRIRGIEDNAADLA
jgi:hypothetical protein